MKVIEKGKKRKYYYEDATVYKCETCGAEYDYSDYIEECPVCHKDICPKCSGAEVANFNGYLFVNEVLSTGFKSSADVYLENRHSNNKVRVDFYPVHKECVIKRLKTKKFLKELKRITDYYNESIEWLNDNTIKENMSKEEYLVNKYTKEIERLTKRNDDYFCKINQYEEELKSNDYKKFKSLNQKQLQMLKLMNEE